MADDNSAAAKAGGEGGEGAAPENKAPGEAGKPEGQDKPAGDKPEAKPDQPDDGEPPVRGGKTAKDFIIERKNRQIEKAKAKAGTEDKPEEGEDDDPDEEVVAPEDEKIISKVIRKELSPLFQQQEQQALDSDIKAFLAENPDMAEFEAKVRKYAVHPTRKHLPVSSIFYEVAGPALMKIGAKRAQQADEKAKQKQSGGSGVRGDEAKGADDVWSQPKDEFQKRVQKVLQR